jgi:peptidyl-tRNA hydrolase, PTH1 family
MAVDAIAAAHDFPAWRKRFSGLASEGKLGGEQVLLFKPQTFRNESGHAVGEAVRFYKLDLSDLIVFHDELDFAQRKARVKVGGGVAGHNGLKSLTAHIGNDYVRVRIGIGHPGNKTLVTGHVLQNFTKAELEWLEPLLGAIAEEAPHLAQGASNKFQSRVAYAMQGEAKAETEEDEPAKKPAPRRKETSEKKEEQPVAEGTLAGKLRRWFGS